MNLELKEFPFVIQTTTAPVAQAQGNLHLIQVYRKGLQERFLRTYLLQLHSVVKASVSKIKESDVKKTSNYWIDKILVLSNNPFNYNAWENYFDSYLKVIEASTSFFSKETDNLKVSIEAIKSPEESEAGIYMVQVLESFIDVFIFLHKLFSQVKDGKKVVPNYDEQMAFEELTGSLVSLSSITEDMVSIVNKNLSLDDKVIENYVNIVSNLKVSILKACSIFRIQLEEKTLSETTKGILDALSTNKDIFA